MVIIYQESRFGKHIQEADRSLIPRVNRQVYLYLLDLCKDPDLAEEITQETFFKVLKKIDTFEGKCDIGTWMIQIAKNAFYNHCKKKKYERVEDWESIPAKDNPENRRDMIW